ncbi:MAG: RDD family protein [Tepidiformaceae bacterium]
MFRPVAETQAPSLRLRPGARPRIYLSPSNRDPHVCAGQLDRLASLAADVVLYVLACPVAVGAAALLLRPFWPLGAAAIFLGYLAFGRASGQTIGMHLMGIRLIDTRTGRSPSFGQALASAACCTLVTVSLFVLLQYWFGALPATFALPALGVSVATLAAAAVNHLWALADVRGRTLHDRLTGLVVVETAPLGAERAAHSL